jgi:hypothetical protein
MKSEIEKLGEVILASEKLLRKINFALKDKTIEEKATFEREFEEEEEKLTWMWEKHSKDRLGY